MKHKIIQDVLYQVAAKELFNPSVKDVNKIKVKCKDCGKLIWPGQTYCKQCHRYREQDLLEAEAFFDSEF